MSGALWEFALDRYARPQVEALCLQRQAEGADVCLLLCAAWLGQRGVRCEPARQKALQNLALVWQAEVVGPLRALRQAWRTLARTDAALDALRQQLKQLELQSEHILLDRLEQASLGWPEQEADSLDDWLNALGGPQAAQSEALRDLQQALQSDQA